MLSSPSNRQIFARGDVFTESAPVENVERVDDGRLSSYSSNDRSADDVDAGDSVGDCTMSCRNDGSSGVGAYKSLGLASAECCSGLERYCRCWC